MSISQATMLWDVKSARSVHYQVVSSENLFDIGNDHILGRGFRQTPEKRRCLIVIDTNVFKLYGKSIAMYFAHHAVEIELIKLTVSESEKVIDSVLAIVSALNEFGISRQGEPLMGIGGGILLDIVGMAASLYRRGISYIRVPTTLIGLIDAGIGIKTGVNFDLYKSRLGTYCPPLVAYLDRSFLKTLDQRHMSNGLAEILKLALVKDGRLFELMESNIEGLIFDRLQGSTEYDEIFQRAVTGMIEELETNLWEDDLNRRMDFGHSFSPSLEMNALPELLHGEAVNIDMVFSMLLALGRGFLLRQDFERVLKVMRNLHLPVTHKLCNLRFMQNALDEVTKHRNGLRLPLNVGIGDCTFVNDIVSTELQSAVSLMQDMGL
ncbi:MAG: sedoheptulose 7-phosphate cyclase [Candidatus Methylumidiphilus sp.]